MDAGPQLDAVKSQLGTRDAAVVELVNIRGSQWGADDRWVAFVATADGIEIVDPLPRQEELEMTLHLLRGGPAKDLLEKLPQQVLKPLPRSTYSRKEIVFAPDQGMWRVPFSVLRKPRWRWLPRKALSLPFLGSFLGVEMEQRHQVSADISTSHLLRLGERQDPPPSDEGLVVVGVPGDDPVRAWCIGFAKSLEANAPGHMPGRWQVASGEIPDLEGDFALFVGDWHTEYAVDSRSLAEFQIGPKPTTLASFLSQCRIRAPLTVPLTCHGLDVPPKEAGDAEGTDEGGAQQAHFPGGSDGGPGNVRGPGATAVVSTAFTLHAEHAYVFGRYLWSSWDGARTCTGRLPPPGAG